MRFLRREFHDVTFEFTGLEIKISGTFSDMLSYVKSSKTGGNV